MITEKEIKKYISNIRSLLPAHFRAERLFLNNMQINIKDYADANPSASPNELIEHFGEPADIVRCYVESIDIDALIQKISIRKLFRKIFILILTCAIIGLIIFSVFSYKAYLEYKNTIVHETETVITDE